MHVVPLDADAETPIDAILNGDPIALLLTSCVFKMTRRDVRLYRILSFLSKRASVKLDL